VSDASGGVRLDAKACGSPALPDAVSGKWAAQARDVPAQVAVDHQPVRLAEEAVAALYKQDAGRSAAQSCADAAVAAVSVAQVRRALPLRALAVAAALAVRSE
jgi:hypothetical protein